MMFFWGKLMRWKKTIGHIHVWLSETYDSMTSYLNDKRSKVKLKQRLNWSLRDRVIVNRMFCDLMFLKVDENILDKFMINPYLQIIHYGLSGLIHIMMPLLQRSGQYLHWVLCNIDFVRNCSHFPVHKVYESAVMKGEMSIWIQVQWKCEIYGMTGNGNSGLLQL